MTGGSLMADSEYGGPASSREDRSPLPHEQPEARRLNADLRRAGLFGQALAAAQQAAAADVVDP